MQTKKTWPLLGGARKAMRLNCRGPSTDLNNMDQHPELMDYLPKDYQYHVCSYKHVSQPSPRDHISFEATLRMTIKTKEEVQVWLKSMPDTWRVETVKPSKGKKTIMKKVYRCQHKTRNPETPVKQSKNTNCSAKLIVTILPTVDGRRRSRSADPHLPAYPTIVEISHNHNHNIHDVTALQYRDVGAATVEKLIKLFKAGHSPPSALDALKYDLQVKYGDDYLYKSADRSICPDVKFCYRLYSHFMSEYSSTERQEIFEQAPLDSSNGCSDPSPVQSPEMAIAVSEESDDAQTSAEQQVSRSTMAATEWIVGESDVDDEEFRSKMRNFTETLLMNKRLLKGGLKVMMKNIDKMVGHRTMLLAPSMLLSAMHTFGHSGTNSLASQRAQALRKVTNRAGPGTAARVTSIACPEFRLGKLYRIPKGPGRRKKTVKHGSSLQPRKRGVKHSACPKQ